jgi:hypothetical protein
MNEKLSRFKFESEEGPVDRPVFIFQDTLSDGAKVAFHLCPYFGGTGPSVLWPNNPLADVFDEKTDVVVTRIMENGSESSPIFAIEFVDALMAGNQGWQRFRRALNAAEAGITYLYVLPVIGWERDSEGLVLKNPRFLQATVCLAQLTLCSQFGIPSLQIYATSDWSEYAATEGYTLPDDFRSFCGIDSAIEVSCHLVRAAIDKSKYPRDLLSRVLNIIIKEMLSVGRTYCNFGNTSLPIHYQHPALDTASKEKVAEIYAEALIQERPVSGQYALHEISEQEFIKHGALFKKDAQEKTCSVGFRNDILPFLNWKPSESSQYKIKYLKTWGVSVDTNDASDQLDRIALSNKSSLPLTYKENKSEAALIQNRQALRDVIRKAYPKVTNEILNWIFPVNRAGDLPPLFAVPLYAYKPSGDSRPDRGLLPLLKGLFPSLVMKDRTLVIVYSKHTPSNWKTLVEGEGNELWNSIMDIAGALIVDKTGDGILLHSRKVQTKLV